MNKLTVCCLTYNHAAFIRQALDGILSQKTDFDFTVLVHDDASTDETPVIIREYSEKYPDKIKTICRMENLYTQGTDVLRRVLADVKSKYVALCEGDDYWTDPDKLQQQVNFLEQRPDCAICFHTVVVRDEVCGKKGMFFPSQKKIRGKTEFDLKDLLERNFIATVSVMYRWRFNDGSLAQCFPPDISPTDYFLHVLHAERGKIGYIPKAMAVYRKHPGGIWAGAGKSDAFFVSHGLRFLRFDAELRARHGRAGVKKPDRFVSLMVLAYLRQNRYDLLARFAAQEPSLYALAIKTLGRESGARHKKLYQGLGICAALLFFLLLGYCLK